MNRAWEHAAGNGTHSVLLEEVIDAFHGHLNGVLADPLLRFGEPLLALLKSIVELLQMAEHRLIAFEDDRQVFLHVP